MEVFYWVSFAVGLVFTVLMAVVSGYVKVTRDAQKELAAQLDKLNTSVAAHQVEVAGQYMRKEDLRELRSELRADMREYIDLIRSDLREHIARIENQVNR